MKKKKRNKKDNKKKSKASYFLQAVIIISLEFVALTCFTGGHNIIPTAMLSGSGNIILELITNLLYFLVYFFLYIFIICLTTGMYYDKNKALKSMGVLLVLRIVFDIIDLLLGINFVTTAYALNYILESAYVVLMYLLLIRYYSDISFKCLAESKRNIICSISALFSIVALNILHYFICLNEYSKITYYMNKYNATGEQIESVCNKADFICDVYGVALITVVSIIMFAFTAIISPNLQKADERKNRYKGRYKIKCNKFYCVFAIICVSFMAVGVFCFLKYVISRPYCISDINVFSSDVGSKGFYNNYKETTVKAFDSVGNETDVYTQKSYCILYEDKQLLKIKPFTSQDIENTVSGNVLTLNDGTYPIEVEGIEAERFLNHAVMYKSEGAVVAVLTEDIPKLEKDKNMITILKKLILDGYFDYFEYGCEYLLRYDPEFIKPYIARYAKGDFTENELAVNEDIKTDYMINVAKEYVYN